MGGNFKERCVDDFIGLVKKIIGFFCLDRVFGKTGNYCKVVF